MTLVSEEIEEALKGASRHFNVSTEKAVSAFVCRHMGCEPVTSLPEALAILEEAEKKGLEFVMFEQPDVDKRGILIRKIGSQDFIDSMELPSFRDIMLGERV